MNLKKVVNVDDDWIGGVRSDRDSALNVLINYATILRSKINNVLDHSAAYFED